MELHRQLLVGLELELCLLRLSWVWFPVVGRAHSAKTRLRIVLVLDTLLSSGAQF